MTHQELADVSLHALALYSRYLHKRRIPTPRRHPRNTRHHIHCHSSNTYMRRTQPQNWKSSCDVAMINDSLDPRLHNADFYVHPDHPALLLVIATKDLLPVTQIFIELSTQWQTLPSYDAICSHFNITANCHDYPHTRDACPHTVHNVSTVPTVISAIPKAQLQQTFLNMSGKLTTIPPTKAQATNFTNHSVKRKRQQSRPDEPDKQRRLSNMMTQDRGRNTEPNQIHQKQSDADSRSVRNSNVAHNGIMMIP